MIISRTPFRVSFFGGGTDFPAFYNEHGGAVLAGTIDKFCYITIHRLPPFFKHSFKASYSQTEAVQDISEIRHPLIRECLKYLDIKSGLEIAHVADLPGRTGLGSSSSFTVGLLNTLHHFKNERITPEDLAREAIEIERVRVGDTGGHQDQYLAAYGGLVRVDFSADNIASVKTIAIRAKKIQQLEKKLMMFYMGVEQSAETILTEQCKRIKDNTDVLKRMLEMVTEAEHVLTDSQELDHFGELLDEAWQLKKSLSSGISNSAIDDAYQASKQAGAIGGKLLGAGGRGFLLLYAPEERHEAIRQSVSNLKEVDFSFTPVGSQIIFTAQE